MNDQSKIRKIVIAVIVVVIGLGLISTVLTSLGTARMKSADSVARGIYAPGMMAQEGVSNMAAPVPAAAPRRDIIQTAELSLVVEKTEETVASITNIANTNGGYVQSSQISDGSSGSKYGSMVLRVPAAKLTEVLNQMKSLATKVSSERLNSEDVTAQLVDMEARLKNLAAEEESYRSLMSRSGKIDDVLAVTRELARVRGEIEQLTASRKYLSEQVAMSAITVSLTSVSEAQVAGIVWRPIATAKTAVHDLLSGLADLADWLISIVIRLPLLLIKLAIFVLVLWIVWKIGWSLKRKFFSAPTV